MHRIQVVSVHNRGHQTGPTCATSRALAHLCADCSFDAALFSHASHSSCFPGPSARLHCLARRPPQAVGTLSITGENSPRQAALPLYPAAPPRSNVGAGWLVTENSGLSVEHGRHRPVLKDFVDAPCEERRNRKDRELLEPLLGRDRECVGDDDFGRPAGRQSLRGRVR